MGETRELVERLRAASTHYALFDNIGRGPLQDLVGLMREAAERLEELERKAVFAEELVQVYRAKNKATFAAQGQGMDGYTLLAHYDNIAERASDADQSS